MANKDVHTELKLKLAQACRVLYMEGLADYNLGHVSCRIPDNGGVYIKPQGLGLEEITPDDLIRIDMECNKLEGSHPPHGENPIHTEIYKEREDVQSVVHVHPVFCTAFSSVQVDLETLNQDGVIFPYRTPRFSSPELVTTKAQGHELALTLGSRNAVILKNHGIVTVGPRIEEACMNAIFFENALKVQGATAQFGKLDAISKDVALKMNEFCKSPKRYDMIWNYLVRKLDREGLGFK